MSIKTSANIVFMIVLIGYCLAPFRISAQDTGSVTVPAQQKEGVEHSKQAEKYFDQLHKVSANYNWKLVNQAVREQRYARHSKVSDGTQADTPRVTGTWQEVGSANQAGRVVAVDFDAATNRVWTAGAGGTIWQGDAQGSSWKILNESRRISDPQLIKNVKLKNGKERLIVVSNAARAFYLDEGSTQWMQATGTEEMQRWGSFQHVVSCTRNGELEIFGFGNEWDYSKLWRGRNVLYMSSDSGVSYKRIKWFDGLGALWTDGYDNVILVNGDTLSYVQSDGTVTDERVSTLWQGASQIVMGGADISLLMMAISKGDSTSFYMSSDVGEQWEFRSTIKYRPFNRKSFHQTNGNKGVWMFGAVDVHRTTDDGLTWKIINGWGQYYNNPSVYLHADIPSITSFKKSDGKPLTFICTDGGLYKTEDEGSTVKNISLSGLNVGQYYSSYSSRDNVDVVYIGSQDQGFQRSRVVSAGARDFRQMISGDYSSLVSGDGGHTVYCVYPGFVMYINSAEDNWSPRTLDFVHTKHLWLPPLASLSSNPKQVLLGGGTNGDGAFLYLYEPNPDTLRATKLPFDFGAGAADVRITAVNTFEKDDRYQYVVTSANKVFFSNDKGLSWTQGDRPAGLREHYFSGNAIAIDDKTASTMYLGGSGYDQPGVYATNNSGETFLPLTGLPPCLVLGLAVGVDGRYVAAATDVGAFVYDTLTKAWTDVTTLNAPDQTYWDVDWIPQLGRFRFSTYGRGVWDFIPGAPVSVEVATVTPTNELTVRSYIEGADAQLEIQSAIATVVSVAWYDLEGRVLSTQRHQVHAGVNVVSVPKLNSNMLFAVLKTDAGLTAGCVVQSH